MTHRTGRHVIRQRIRTGTCGAGAGFGPASAAPVGSSGLPTRVAARFTSPASAQAARDGMCSRAVSPPGLGLAAAALIPLPGGHTAEARGPDPARALLAPTHHVADRAHVHSKQAPRLSPDEKQPLPALIHHL